MSEGALTVKLYFSESLSGKNRSEQTEAVLLIGSTTHEQLTKQLGVPVYFCHPYSSPERGTAENRIGVIRQYLRKGSELKYIKHKSLKVIEWKINDRPMRCLAWKTPYKFFLERTLN